MTWTSPAPDPGLRLFFCLALLPAAATPRVGSSEWHCVNKTGSTDVEAIGEKLCLAPRFTVQRGGAVSSEQLSSPTSSQSRKARNPELGVGKVKGCGANWLSPPRLPDLLTSPPPGRQSLCLHWKEPSRSESWSGSGWATAASLPRSLAVLPVCPSDTAGERGVSTSCFQPPSHIPSSTSVLAPQDPPPTPHDYLSLHLVILIYGATSTFLAGQAGSTL